MLSKTNNLCLDHSWFDWTRFLDQNLTNPAKNISRSFHL